MRSGDASGNVDGIRRYGRHTVTNMDFFLLDLNRLLDNLLDALEEAVSLLLGDVAPACTSAEQHQLTHKSDLLLTYFVYFLFVVLLHRELVKSLSHYELVLLSE